ncbi:uncharacterized protein LOC109819710 [Asparagus officinalis]|uniref:uncharacterized protein LOC109819710 n=1 Tax=Asparagus officinalis TaxID=4686 RepID=UPI00098DEFF4|nr:uncharacterized protein LOC109819710 [Asparagus officinalis]
MSSQKKAPVFISVYVVKPRRSTDRQRPYHHHHHHYHHVHHHQRGGYDRKAELLQHCQRLRTSAHREQTPSTPKTSSRLTSNKIIPLYRNPSIRRNPTCLGNWRRLLIPGFILRPGVIFRRKKEKKMAVKKMSDSMGNTMLLIAKNIRVEKQQGFVKKLLSTFRRRK